MSRYRYLKKYPPRLFGKSPEFFLRAFSVVFSFFGLVLVANAVGPVVSYQFRLSPQFQEEKMISPVANDLNLTNLSVFNQVLGETDKDDLTNIRNWFPEAPFPSPNPRQEILSYKLSIPELRIFNADVEVGVENLDKNLVQYPGTGTPGKPGNTVVFGHSVLPQFFNPKNYKTIFSTLPTITKKAQILVDYDEVRYSYSVEELNEVPPNDLSILAQRYDDSYLTLVTCVPPGTYLRRLVVRARLTK